MKKNKCKAYAIASELTILFFKKISQQIENDNNDPD